MRIIRRLIKSISNTKKPNRIFNEILNERLHVKHDLDNNNNISDSCEELYDNLRADFTLYMTDIMEKHIGEARIVYQGIQRIHHGNLLSFGFTNIYVDEAYRQKGVCTILLADIIFTLIKNKPDEDFIFWLTNTSQTIIDENSAVQYKIYDSILNKICTKDKRVQYKIFSAEERINDIKYLEELLIRKQSYLIDEIG